MEMEGEAKVKKGGVMTKKKSDIKALQALVDAIAGMGWQVAVPKTGKNVVGLVIGSTDYVDSITKCLTDNGWKWKPKTKKGK